MGYNKKRIRGVHRIYDKDIDWAVNIGDSKRFIIDTVPYCGTIQEEDIEYAAKYCLENQYPFGFITNGDEFAIVSGCADDEQPILKSQMLNNPDEAAKILEFYDYKSYDSSKIREYYMQFQFTMNKLKDRLAQSEAREAIYKTAEEFAECKHSDRNVGIIKKFIDQALDGKQVQSLQETVQSDELQEIEKQLNAEKDELEQKIKQLEKQLSDAQSKMDSDQTLRSELQAEIDEKTKEIQRLNSEIERNKKELEDKLRQREDELVAEIEALKEEMEHAQEPQETQETQEPQEVAEESVENYPTVQDDDKLRLEEIEDRYKHEIENLSEAHRVRVNQLESELNTVRQELELAKQGQIHQAYSETVDTNQDDYSLTDANSGVKVEAKALVVDDESDVEELKNQIAEQSNTIGKLESDCEQAKQVIADLTKTKAELEDELKRLNKQIEELQENQNNQENQDTDSSTDEAGETGNVESTEHSGQLEEALRQKEIKIVELTEELRLANEKLKIVQIELEQIKKSRTIQTDEVKLEIAGDNERMVKDLILENQQLKTQIDIMVKSGDLSSQADAFALEVGKYREQINGLHVEVGNLTQQLNQAKITIEELNEKLVSKGSAKQVAAQELLDSIEDDDEQERTYVAVIDDNLYQERDIRRFVGICIEELYKTAAVSLMPTLYDSQNFIIKEVKSDSDCDLTLGTKRFILDISNDTEDSIMAKVVQLYKAYPDRVFYCKKIGTQKADFNDLYHNADDRDIGNSIIIDDDADKQFNQAVQDSTADATVDATVDGDYNDGAYVGADELNDQEQNQDGKVTGYGFFGIRGTNQLLEYEYADCVSMPYIYTQTNGRYYGLDTSQLGQQLIMAIQSLIAACPAERFEQAIKNYKNIVCEGRLEQMNQVNRHLTKLPMTKLVIVSLNGMKDLIDILTCVADALGYDEPDVTVMYEIRYYENDEIVQGCLADINSVSMVNNIEFDERNSANSMELFEKKIDGGIVDNTILSRNQLEIQNKVFKGLTRVITDVLNDEIVEDAQFEQAMSKMLNNQPLAKKRIDPKLFGPVVGTNKMIISTNRDEVAERNVQVKAGNQVYYIQRLEPVQQMYALIRMQQVLYGNKQIVFNMNISTDAFEFYRDSFATQNPQLDILVRTLVNYIETRV